MTVIIFVKNLQIVIVEIRLLWGNNQYWRTWLFFTQRRKGRTEQKEEKSKGFCLTHSGSNIANRQLGDCDPTPSGGRTQYCRKIRYWTKKAGSQSGTGFAN